MTDRNDRKKPGLLPFWLDKEGNDRTAYCNFYQYCLHVEKITGARLGTGPGPQSDPVRFRPWPGMGFPTGELRCTETDPENPDMPPTVRTNFLGLYGVDSPLPTTYIDDILTEREGHEAMTAFLDIFNHRIMTQFYRIWRKKSWPHTFEPGGTDSMSQRVMAMTGITRAREYPTSRLMAMLHPMLHTTLTAEGIESVIRSQAPHTSVRVTPHHPARMYVRAQAQFTLSEPMSLQEHPVTGDTLGDVNYCARVEMYTEDREEADGWMPDGELRRDVFSLLRVYLGCDYDLQLWVTIPTRFLPVPRMGDDRLFSGCNVMLGLRDDNLEDMPLTARISVGNVRHEGDG